MSEEARWGTWECATIDCGQVLSAKLKTCPVCGDPRNPEITPSEKPYFDPNGELIVGGEDEEWAQAGPAINCGNCGELNRGDSTVCGFCDEPIGANDTVRAVTEYRSGIDTANIDFDDEPDDTSGWQDEVEYAERVLTDEPERGERRVLPMDRLHDRPGRSSLLMGDDGRSRSPMFQRAADKISAVRPETKKKAGIFGGAAAFLTATVVGAVSLFGTEPVSLTVVDVEWERQVEIETYQTLEEKGWTYPSDARILSSKEEIRSYRTVSDGFYPESYQSWEQTGTSSRQVTDYCNVTVDNGNGTFSSRSEACGSHTVSDPVYGYVTRERMVEKTHQEAVWDTKYTYEIDRWTTFRWVVTSDDYDDGVLEEPVWAENLALESGERLGNERNERYRVEFDNNDNEDDRQDFSADMNQTVWSTFEPGDQVTAEVNRFGQLSEIIEVGSRG